MPFLKVPVEHSFALAVPSKGEHLTKGRSDLAASKTANRSAMPRRHQNRFWLEVNEEFVEQELLNFSEPDLQWSSSEADLRQRLKAMIERLKVRSSSQDASVALQKSWRELLLLIHYSSPWPAVQIQALQTMATSLNTAPLPSNLINTEVQLVQTALHWAFKPLTQSEDAEREKHEQRKIVEHWQLKIIKLVAERIHFYYLVCELKESHLHMLSTCQQQLDSHAHALHHIHLHSLTARRALSYLNRTLLACASSSADQTGHSPVQPFLLHTLSVWQSATQLTDANRLETELQRLLAWSLSLVDEHSWLQHDLALAILCSVAVNCAPVLYALQTLATGSVLRFSTVAGKASADVTKWPWQLVSTYIHGMENVCRLSLSAALRRQALGNSLPARSSPSKRNKELGSAKMGLLDMLSSSSWSEESFCWIEQLVLRSLVSLAKDQQGDNGAGHDEIVTFCQTFLLDLKDDGIEHQIEQQLKGAEEYCNFDPESIAGKRTTSLPETIANILASRWLPPPSPSGCHSKRNVPEKPAPAASSSRSPRKLTTSPRTAQSSYSQKAMNFESPSKSSGKPSSRVKKQLTSVNALAEVDWLEAIDDIEKAADEEEAKLQLARKDACKDFALLQI